MKKIMKEIKENCIIKINNKINYCSSLTNIDLSNFYTKNVTNMSFMFYGCKSLIKKNLII